MMMMIILYEYSVADRHLARAMYRHRGSSSTDCYRREIAYRCLSTSIPAAQQGGDTAKQNT